MFINSPVIADINLRWDSQELQLNLSHSHSYQCSSTTEIAILHQFENHFNSASNSCGANIA